MEANKRLRTPLRARITRTIVEAEALMTNPVVDLQLLRVKLAKLENVMPKLISLDRKIMNAMVEADCTDEEQAN